jgi:hypothetical protein
MRRRQRGREELSSRDIKMRIRWRAPYMGD